MTAKLEDRADQRWRFWIDRGGTFTDVVAQGPDGTLNTQKLLSVNPEAYPDAALQAIRNFLNIGTDEPLPAVLIEHVKMGTTVATNALLERKGDATLLVINRGLGDVLEIGYQARADVFALNIKKPSLIYDRIIEVDGRLDAHGEEIAPIDPDRVRAEFEKARKAGFSSIAIVLMHADRFPQHELALADIAREVGFDQISCSHDVSPLTRIVSRGDTTVVDAYLTPVLNRYIERIAHEIDGTGSSGSRLYFMRSSGGLAAASDFRGRDAILSGPAGGVVGAVRTSSLAGFDKIIGFDMGGTSTDVAHYNGEFEKALETEVAGVRMRVPMMDITTVAAGGGSILHFDKQRFRVGPDSAGAMPGPKAYRRGGPLTVTDANVCLGKLRPEYFPKIFGPKQNRSLDSDAVDAAFSEMSAQLGNGRSKEEIAEGFLRIAVDHMAQAVKKISIARGYDLTNYALASYGGAGGQHACLVANEIGIKTILFHPFSGVLSAYGMGLADVQVENYATTELPLAEDNLLDLSAIVESLKRKNVAALADQGVPEQEIEHRPNLMLRYEGTDTTLRIKFDDVAAMRAAFLQQHQRRFGFVAHDTRIITESAAVESLRRNEAYKEPLHPVTDQAEPKAVAKSQFYSGGGWQDATIYDLDDIRPGHRISGPAMIVEPNGTIIIEPSWEAGMNARRHLIVRKDEAKAAALPLPGDAKSVQADPVMLEIFNNLFMSIAEQMGTVLRNTSQSVNIKERLDFSCAIFDAEGALIANAPHMPVHLGSMGATVKGLRASDLDQKPGDVFVQNNPYNGGSHLPDINVITPVFDAAGESLLFYVASRAHHADIGGVTPGSMPPGSTDINEEGVIIDTMKLVEEGVFQTSAIKKALTDAPYPARNPEQNIADLMAQVAANNKGVGELGALVETYGLDTVQAYMGHIQDNAEEEVCTAIGALTDGAFEYEMDSGAVIKVTISVDHERRSATIDFSGTSAQQDNNFNAPAAIIDAAVIYAFRCLTGTDIPLNAGCMKPLRIIVPGGSLLNPDYPHAVVAGNVEVSQALTNAIFGALGVLGSSQGTMNNLTFGNEKYQYYETICSGAPAGPGFDGAAAVHTHMTNSRLTDPEILEMRYPVRLEEFSIRRDSGGKGEWNGGDGVLRKIRFLEPMRCAILSDNRRIAPVGTNGGEAGEAGRNLVIRADGSELALNSCDAIEMGIGDTIVISTPTGGGFGKSR